MEAILQWIARRIKRTWAKVQPSRETYLSAAAIFVLGNRKQKYFALKSGIIRIYVNFKNITHRNEGATKKAICFGITLSTIMKTAVKGAAVSKSGFLQFFKGWIAPHLIEIVKNWQSFGQSILSSWYILLHFFLLNWGVSYHNTEEKLVYRRGFHCSSYSQTIQWCG